MKRTSFAIALILQFTTAAHGQSKPVVPARPTPRPVAHTPTKPELSGPTYLTGPFDLAKTNLGTDFGGHDITAVVEAIKKSSALKEKSEFESTSEFQARRARFVHSPLYAEVTPDGYVCFVLGGFVVGNVAIFAPEFKYDADSRTLAITVSGRTKRFVTDKGEPTLDDFPIRQVLRTSDRYIGSNAFGAKANVRHTFSEEYAVLSTKTTGYSVRRGPTAGSSHTCWP